MFKIFENQVGTVMGLSSVSTSVHNDIKCGYTYLKNVYCTLQNWNHIRLSSWDCLNPHSYDVNTMSCKCESSNILKMETYRHQHDVKQNLESCNKAASQQSNLTVTHYTCTSEVRIIQNNKQAIVSIPQNFSQRFQTKNYLKLKRSFIIPMLREFHNFIFNEF